MKGKKLYIAALPLALLLMTAGCAKEEKEQLETITVSRGEMVRTVTATGTVESVTSVDVGTQVTGIISNLYVDYNSEVKKGELIAELEKTVLESELKSAEASVLSAKATYDYNRINFDRDKVLHSKQLISDYEFQTSQKDLEVSKMAYDKAVADKVRAAKNLNYAEIYSPIDGIVISRDVEVGQTVVSNMSVANLYTIADLDHMQVIGNVDEADIGQVKMGQRVTFTVDAFPDDTFSGEVTQVRLSPTTESNVVTYEVVVSAENPDHKLIPGLTANLVIYTLEERNVITLPLQALAFEPQGEKPAASNDAASNDRVWVVENGKLTPRKITVGTTNGVSAVVLSGLEDGDKVATGYTSAPQAPSGGESQTQSPFAPKHPGKKK